MYQEWGWESGVFLNNSEEKSQKILSLINEHATPELWMWQNDNGGEN